jgi:hypothetical protein
MDLLIKSANQTGNQNLFPVLGWVADFKNPDLISVCKIKV